MILDFCFNFLFSWGQAEKEFKVEVEAIGRVRHKNLVRLLDYCVEGSYRMLVYEYVDNGNLDQWLHGDVGDVSPLTWEIRMNIILGTTKGYVAPEYASMGMLNEKSDVYNFVILIMEIITGRCPVDYSRPQLEVNLVDWLKMMVGNRQTEEVIDPKLPERSASKATKRLILVALRCVDPDAQKRPKMGHIIHMLELEDLLFRDVCEYLFTLT
ncbi:Probable serine/threonine-protein kinase [Striga hermonthica]|uniref:non-specific serine/threonine protein kinase n=1 Tax=Striga hermonthica TaxID=68872 RepID=A0A9N7NZG7_STRHE|nr:Probable serine/threonine-protein kinase [Striga hermonthica]